MITTKKRIIINFIRDNIFFFNFWKKSRLETSLKTSARFFENKISYRANQQQKSNFEQKFGNKHDYDDGQA